MVAGRFQTALLIEPAPQRRPPLQRLLREAGFREVLTAGSAAEARALLKEALVDLVVTAWEVPGGSGAALIRAVRQGGRNRALPVILVDTGLPQHAVVAAVKAGAAGRLPWPGTVQQLRGIMATILEDQHPQDSARAAPSPGAPARGVAREEMP